MPLQTYRHTLYYLLPKWARNFYLFSALYAIAIICDCVYTMALAAVKIRWPGAYSYESCSRLGWERGLIQAPREPDDVYATRLCGWWDVQKRAGHFRTLAELVQRYCYPATPYVAIVQNDGVRYVLQSDGTWVEDTVAWSWDIYPERFSRFWVVIENTVEGLNVVAPTRTVGDSGAAVGMSGRQVGHDLARLGDRADAAAIRDIVETWRPPHTFCDCILVVMSSQLWTNLPGGNWDYWDSRNACARYWKGTL
jgi:hypothetical protein